MGDVVMEVNGQSVDGKPLEDVTMLVEEGGHIPSLLVTHTTRYTKMEQTEAPSKDVTRTEVAKQFLTLCLYLSRRKKITRSQLCERNRYKPRRHFPARCSHSRIPDFNPCQHFQRTTSLR